MKNMRFIPISTVAAAVVLLATSCVKNTLYNTPHPNHGKIAVTVDWSGRGAGLDLPALWMVSLGDYTGTERSATHAPEQLFTPGEYTLAAWNPMEKIAVADTTATVATVPGNGSAARSFIEPRPVWFFTSVQQVQIEKDKDHTFTAVMRQQTRELTLVVEPVGDAADRITEIVACLTGAAGTLDFATDTHGTPSNVALDFTKITSGDDAGKWTATVRLLGVAGTSQQLQGEVRYAEGNPLPTTLTSDLTAALKEFNAKKTEPLTLGGTLVETPEEAEFPGAEINGWEEIESGEVNAEM